MIWNEPEFYPDAVITRVYGSDDILRNKKSGIGWVQVNLLGFSGETNETVRKKWNVDAMLIMPYSFKPTTEDAQSSTKKLQSPLNQQYGMIAPPRRGDKAIVVYLGPKRYFVMGVYPAPGGNEPPSYTPDDLSLIHRSGASIRLNDKHPGVTAPAEDEYDGITGAMSTVANRAIHLIGSKFLPYGLMAEHASQLTKIDLNIEDSDGYAYADIFDDSEPGTAYYQPWDPSMGSDWLLGPPHSDLSGTDVGSNEFYLLHQGGGLFRLYPQPSDTEYTGLKIAIGGWTISVGKEYWDAGIQNVDTSSGAHTDTQSTAPVEGQIVLQNSAGAYIKMDPSGNVVIESQGTIKLGTNATQAVVTHGDSTGVATTKMLFFMDAPPHSHQEESDQSEVLAP